MNNQKFSAQSIVGFRPGGRPENDYYPTPDYAVQLWNQLPRRGEVQVTTDPICDRCGCEIVPGLVHYCYDEKPIEGE